MPCTTQRSPYDFGRLRRVTRAISVPFLILRGAGQEEIPDRFQVGCHDVILGAEIQTFEPAFGAPDRRLIHADGQDVELATRGSDVGGDPAAQRVLI